MKEPLKITLLVLAFMATGKISIGQISIQIHNKTGYNVYSLNYQGYYLGDLNKDKVSPIFLLDSVNTFYTYIKGSMKELDLYEPEFHAWCGTGMKIYKDTTFVLDLILNETPINKPHIILKYHEN